MNHYELLGISRDAGREELKRAYFAGVKKFPPERFPEEFKALRKAYETLGDEKARKLYDASMAAPEDARELYESAERAIRGGCPEDAVELLKERAWEREEPALLSLLGRAYRDNENFGLAVKAYERAAELSPTPAALTELGLAYRLRGYHKKAVVAYQEAIKLDEAHLNAWAGLARLQMETKEFARAERTLSRAFAIAEEKGIENAELLLADMARALALRDAAQVERCAERLRAYCKERPSERLPVARVLDADIFSITPDDDAMRPYYPALSLLCELAPDHEAACELKRALHARLAYETLTEEGYPQHIADLTLAALEGGADADVGAPELEVMRAIAQNEAFHDPSYTRRELLRLKDAHPEFYEMNKAFYAKVLDVKNEQRYFEETYTRLMQMKKRYPGVYRSFFAPDGDAFFEQETVVRAEPKIGRNDPCPCGSGRKYKKCCGAGA